MTPARFWRVSEGAAAMTPEVDDVPFLGDSARQEQIERWLLVIASLAAALLAYVLFLAPANLDLALQSADGPKVAVLAQANGVVRRRPAGVPVWLQAQTQNALARHDQVFTDEHAQAVVTFSGGTGIELKEKSLVVIDVQDHTATLDLIEGRIYLHQAGKHPDLVVRLPGTDTQVQVTGGTALVTRDAVGAFHVSVLTGTAAVKSGHQKETLHAAEAAVVQEVQNAGKNQTTVHREPLAQDVGKDLSLGQPPQLLAPYPGQRLMLPTGRQAHLFFAWQRTLSQTFRLEVARDPGFQDLVYSRNQAVSPTPSPALAPHVYYWRVAALGVAAKPGPWSKTWSFTVASQTAPNAVAAPRVMPATTTVPAAEPATALPPLLTPPSLPKEQRIILPKP